MTDQSFFPRLLDLPTAELEKWKQHLLAEIAREPERRRHLSSMPLVRSARLRFALVAAAALGATMAAMAATGTFSGSTAPPTAQQGGGGHGDIVRPPTSISYTRAGGVLSSIALTLTPINTDGRIQLQVIYSDASTYSGAYAQEYAGNAPVVFQEQVSTTPLGSDSSSWSGTLAPSDWSGGCQEGLYRITWVTDGTKDASEWFRCTGAPLPTS